jgi:hypothetical protein
LALATARLSRGFCAAVLHSARPLALVIHEHCDALAFSLQAIEFIEKYSAFFLIESTQARVNTGDGHLSHQFCTNLSTISVGCQRHGSVIIAWLQILWRFSLVFHHTSRWLADLAFDHLLDTGACTCH